MVYDDVLLSVKASALRRVREVFGVVETLRDVLLESRSILDLDIPHGGSDIYGLESALAGNRNLFQFQVSSPEGAQVLRRYLSRLSGFVQDPADEVCVSFFACRG
jgi:hypothetical protein